MRQSKWMKLLAIMFTFALIAAACGDDDDDSGSSEEVDTGDDGDSALGGDDGATEEETPEEDMTEEETPEEDMTEEETPEEDGAAGGGTVSDAEQGDGAEMWEQLIDNPPGPADESMDPIVVSMPNIEGTPIGSFPEIREGADAAAKNINENLGGMNGRPIEFKPCVHGADPNEATACGNEIADENPHLNIQGIDFFNPLLWPTLIGAGIPTMQTVPIFISDFDSPGIISTEGGCVSAFPGGAQYQVEVLESDKIAVIHSDTGPGFECFQDTQERFYNQLQEETGAFEWAGFPDASGDPTDNDAVVQNVADFLEGAENPSIYFGIQASDCNEILSALSAADVQATIVASGACRDDSVLANPASAGVHFGGTDTIFERPDLWTDYQIKAFDARQAAIDAYGPEAPQSTFMEVAHDVMMSAWIAMMRFENDGGDIEDRAAFVDFLTSQTNIFRVGGVNGQDCTANPDEFESVCQRKSNHYVWSGPDGQFEYGPLGPDPLDATDLIVRTGEGNPRPAAEE